MPRKRISSPRTVEEAEHDEHAEFAAEAAEAGAAQGKFWERD